jgi:hypothetical protein
MATGPGTPPGGIPHRGGIYCSIANKLIASARPPARQCPVGLETPFLLELRPHPHALEQGRGEDRRADHNNGAEGGGHLQRLGEGLLGRCHELGCNRSGTWSPAATAAPSVSRAASAACGGTPVGTAESISPR